MTVLLGLAFLLSGAAALLFETLWFRQAGLMFGNGIWASSLVTASFMGGLALGNAAAGRHAGRLRRPVFGYALLEAAVGATGLGLVLLFPALTPALSPWFGPLLAHPVALNALRLALAFVLLLVPSAAMGATLPLLVRALTPGQAGFGRALGWLYGWNTLGAVAGALGAESLFVPALGVRGTGFVAAGLDALAATAALWIARRLPDLPPESASVARGIPEARPRGRAPLLAGAFLSGGILLALEVVWFRLLLLFVVGNSRAFAALLAAVLVGIAAGGFIAAAWLHRRPEAHRLLPFIALASALATVFTYADFPQALDPTVAPPLAGQLRAFVLALRLMLPTCLLSGILFTLFGQALRQTAAGEARAAGHLTLANTTGAMLGALLAGFVLLPGLGVELSLALLAAAYVAVGLCTLAWWVRTSRPSRREGLLLAASAAACVLYLWLFPFGLMQNHFLKRVATRFTTWDGSRPVAVREGLTETLMYLRWDLLGEPVGFRLVTNGFSMSSSQFLGQRYMKLFVYWALAVHPEAKRALLISYGVGSTAKALTDTASLESIDVVDTSRDVLELGRLVFPPPERPPLDDPRVRVHVEDGRFFLLSSGRSYDLITAEPPPPRLARIDSLYSREYFQLLYERLREGGVATYWLPVYQMGPRDARAIMRAFCDAFADCSLWTGFGPELILAGTRGARGPRDAGAFARIWRDPVTGPSLRAIGVESPELLGTLFLADAPLLRGLIQAEPPLDDDHPYRLWHAPRVPAEMFLSLAEPEHARRRFAESALVRRLWPEAVRRMTLDHFEENWPVHRMAWAFYVRGDAKPMELAHQILTRSSLRTPVLWLMNSGDGEQRIAAQARARGVQDPRLQEQLAAGAMADRDYARAARLLEPAQPGTPIPEPLAQWRLLALGLAGDHEGARALLRQVGSAIPLEDGETWRWLAATFGLPEPGPDATRR